MVNGPPCPRCGYPLRWLPEQNAWGCDRERQILPPQAVAPMSQAPPAPAQSPWPPPQQSGMPPPRAGAPRPASAKTLLIGAVLVISVIVVIAVIAVVTGGSSSNRIDGSQLMMQEMEAARDAACACHDEACVREALEMSQSALNVGEGHKLSSEQDARIRAALKEMATCVERVPGTDLPPAGTKAGDLLRELAALRDRTCACGADVKCTSAATYENEKWFKRNRAELEALPEDTQKKGIEIAEGIQKCIEGRN